MSGVLGILAIGALLAILIRVSEASRFVQRVNEWLLTEAGGWGSW